MRNVCFMLDNESERSSAPPCNGLKQAHLQCIVSAIRIFEDKSNPCGLFLCPYHPLFHLCLPIDFSFQLRARVIFPFFILDETTRSRFFLLLPESQYVFFYIVRRAACEQQLSRWMVMIEEGRKNKTEPFIYMGFRCSSYFRSRNLPCLKSVKCLRSMRLLLRTNSESRRKKWPQLN